MRKLITGPGLALLALALNFEAVNATAADNSSGIFARIDDLVISQTEFQQIFQAAVRHKYYHGKVPAGEIEQFRRKVADDIVTQILVHNAALEQGLQPDRDKINQGIDAFNLQNAANPDWEQRRDYVIPKLIERLERQDLIEKMESKIRDVPAPTAQQVKQFYLAKPEKFTEPEKLWIAVILLKVPPAAAESAWIEAESRLEGLRQRIEAGDNFADLARELSQHPSAVNGGDLGYLHQGMLEDAVQRRIEGLQVDQLSEPIRVLEGVTLFQLKGIQPARLREFGEVQTRAAGLLHRELQDRAWQEYVEDLRSAANVYVSE